jgi:hypothetical protein
MSVLVSITGATELDKNVWRGATCPQCPCEGYNLVGRACCDYKQSKEMISSDEQVEGQEMVGM